tara:strand:- start:1241 stop:2959 length:1719 start_codon:yes stop_codon:yes gene_type:complete
MNTEISLNKFPKLFDFSNERLHIYFKERLIYFFYNLTRKDRQSLYNIHLELNYTFGLLKNILINTKYNDSWVVYLDLFYCLIGQTRDITNGKGERDASYMLIYTFYSYYPTLAIYALYRFVIPIGIKSNNTCYGSWKDIPYFCEFIHTFANTLDHPLIEQCVEMLNNQLIKDERKLLNNNTDISNVAKWIPREKKKLDWLFDRLVINWSNKRHPHILKYCNDNYQFFSALAKCKKLYRTTNSTINKIINTTEIKLCEREYDDIIPHNVPIQHLYKHFDYYCSNNFFSPINSDLFQEYIISNNHFNNHFFKPYSYNYLPIADIIEKAFTYSNFSTKHFNKYKKEIYLLNVVWSKFIDFISFGDIGHVVPFIDVSINIFKDNPDSYYTSVALAIIISQKSLYANRIIAIDKNPIWINLDNKHDLVSMVKEINDITFSMRNTEGKISNAIELFRDGVFESNCDNHINNFTLVIISNFYNIHNDESLYTRLSSLFHYNYIPFFVFWNVSNKFNCSIPLHSNNDKIAFLSGYSMNLLLYLKQLPFLHEVHPSYHIITQILFSPRYFYLSNYLRTQLK